MREVREVDDVEELCALVRHLATVAVDPADGAGMGAWMVDKARLDARLDGLGLGVARAFHSSLEWARDGAGSAATWLTSNTGAAIASTRATIRTAGLAASMRHVCRAAEAGRLCQGKVFHLTRARTDEVEEEFDSQEAQLVEIARGLTVDGLRAYLAAWRLRALEELGRNEPDGEPPIPESVADRLNLFETLGGRGLVNGELSPESFAIVMGALVAELEHWRRSGELAPDDERSLSELYGKAIVDIIGRGSQSGTQHGGPRPLLIGLLDAEALAQLRALLGDEPDSGPGDDPGGPSGPGGSGGTDGAGAGEPSPPSDGRADVDGDTGRTDEDVPPPAEDGPPEPLVPSPHRNRAASDQPTEVGDADDAGRPGAATPAGSPAAHGSALAPRPASQDRQAVVDDRHEESVFERSGRLSAPSATPPAGAAAEPGDAARSNGGLPVCEVAGVGPIGLVAMAALLARGADVCRAVVGPDGEVVALSRTRRAHSAATLVRALARAPDAPLDLGRRQRLGSVSHYRALIARTGGRCNVEGCDAPHWRCQIHHLVPWDRGGPTDQANLVLVCRRHHKLLHAGFGLVRRRRVLRLRRPDGTVVAARYRAGVRG
ncbi:HNH endonuclease [Aquihabitans sp. G128]|uniref:HNH endonuclease n=1 Tax=Aquihabitans sp. G128 TaxID=2849779 RepID=UPI001C21540E|nr:HNH endonuclease [Aquihabitans sp. G128]QXC61779.1 HNH endonuclease [Aquihabitans sp. G128]